jgi:hypothetical protein
MMIGPTETAWLFTCGPRSVRIIRVTSPDGLVRLLVHGPGAAAVSYESADAADYVKYQSDLEQGLAAQGYQLESFPTADRRGGRDRRETQRGSDRRRPRVEWVI